MIDLVKVLRVFAIGRDASDDALATLSAGSTLRRLREDDEVWAQGAPSKRVVLIQSGLVQIARTQSMMVPVTVALFGPREVAGLVAVLQRVPYPAAARVVSEFADIIEISDEAFHQALGDDHGVARSANLALVGQIHALHAKISMLTNGDTEERLVTLVAHLAERFGDEDEHGATFIPLTLTRRMMGELVGARTETVIRTLAKWQHADVFTTLPTGFRIASLPKLMELLEA